ncbi:cell envelope integrity protein TolA [Mesorhizobium opportunistum]|uniref:cell envelope integrity protein TolA n=1 Tax=Mesorhizobium opportunistum TaxID=593909 RepID=UPI00333C42C1
MKRDRPLTDDEMEDRFLHNVVLLDANFNPGTLPHEADRIESDEIDPVMAGLDNVDGAFGEEGLSRLVELDEERPAAPTPAHHLEMTPANEQTAEEKEARLATIRKMMSRYQPGGAAWQDDEQLQFDATKWIKAREERLARKAEQRRKRYAEMKDSEEAEAKATGRAFRRHQSLAGMSAEERRARKAEQDREAQRRCRARGKHSGGRCADDLHLLDLIFEGPPPPIAKSQP